MSNLPSQHADALACEALSEDDLQSVSGGVALVVGRVAPGALGSIGNPVNLGAITGIKPIGCAPCRSGLPLDILNNPAVLPVLTGPLSRF